MNVVRTSGLIVLALLAGAVLGAKGAAAAAPPVVSCDQIAPAPGYSSWSYQETFQPTCHNCFETDIVKTFKDVLSAVKNVEIDIWDNYRSGITGNAVPGEWFVRHGASHVGNANICTGNGKGDNNLGACLTDIQQWSAANPGHNPITLFLDKKEAWSDVKARRRPADLDGLVTSILGSALYKPASLQGTYPSLREAAQNKVWPTMGNLAGRVIVVLTGEALNEYVSDRGRDAALFVAPDTTNQSDVTGTPGGFTDATAKYVVFYNIQATDSRDQFGLTTRANNYVSRLWGSEGWDTCKILNNCINDIALFDWRKGACNGGMATGVQRTHDKP
jgi:hypothetical protein